MALTNYENIVESMLFVSGDAIAIEKISDVLELDIANTKKILENLIKKHELENRGTIIIEVNSSFQMCTNPKYFDYIKKLYKKDKTKTLSQTLIETLAIIAYKQPVTKAKIEEIRGVNCDHSVNKLIKYNLICELGRQDTPGKPILLGTTDEFLKYFGFTNLDKLPTLQPDTTKIF